MVDAAARRGARVRCIWIDTPLAQAQVNLVERLLDRFGRLPSPEELRDRGRREPGVLAPTSQMRALRELEPPADDEGFASVERVVFVRTPSPPSSQGGVFVAASAMREPGWRAVVAQADPDAAHLVFDWRPGRVTRTTSTRTSPTWRQSSPPPSRPSARTAAAPRSAGAGHRFPGCSSRSPARTASIRHARRSPARPPRTGPLRPRSARATSSPEAPAAPDAAHAGCRP